MCLEDLYGLEFGLQRRPPFRRRLEKRASDPVQWTGGLSRGKQMCSRNTRCSPSNQAKTRDVFSWQTRETGRVWSISIYTYIYNYIYILIICVCILYIYIHIYIYVCVLLFHISCYHHPLSVAPTAPTLSHADVLLSFSLSGPKPQLSAGPRIPIPLPALLHRLALQGSGLL